MEFILKQKLGNIKYGLLQKKKDVILEKLKEGMDEEEIKVENEKWCPYFPVDCMGKNIIYLLDRAETREPIKFDAGDKLAVLDRAFSPDKRKKFDTKMPELEGDKVTFIGSTFINFGEKEPYLNHIIALNDCSDMKNVENAEIEC